MARALEFAAAIPPHLDAFLGFDGTGHEELLADGAQRVRLLKDTERTLAQKFRRDARGEWPPLDDLKIAASVVAGTGLGPLAFVTGGRKRANQALQTLGVAPDTPDLQSDLATLILTSRRTNDCATTSASSPRLARSGPAWRRLSPSSKP